MKLTLTILLALIVGVAAGQTKLTPVQTIFVKDSLSNLQLYSGDKIDTVPVIAYCLTNTDKPKFKWIKMYGVSGKWQSYFNINNTLRIYPEYIMPDRKTKSIYKVAYCITK